MINGQVNVSLSTKLFIDGKNPICIDLTSLHDYSQNIYGFFNKSPSEGAFRSSIEESFEKLTQSIQNKFNSEP
jgi:hypothetical protein